MVDQEAQVALGSIEARDRQVGLAQGRSGDREGVDRIGLAGFTTTTSCPGHQLGRDAHDRLA